MASLWIKIEHVTPDKPEVAEIADILDLSFDDIVGKLTRLFIWIDTQLDEISNARGVSKKAIDRSVCCDGFANALLFERVRWLTENENGSVSFVNFERHNGENAKIRAQTARRVAKCTLKKTNGGSVSKALADEEEYRDEEVNTDASASLSCAVKSKEKETGGSGEPKKGLQWLIDQWNEAAERAGLQRSRGPTKKRAVAFKQRMTDPGWIDEAIEAISRIEKSTFCRGGGDRGWIAGIDYLLRPDTVTKLLEGKHDDRAPIPVKPPERDLVAAMAALDEDDRLEAEKAEREGR